MESSNSQISKQVFRNSKISFILFFLFSLVWISGWLINAKAQQTLSAQAVNLKPAWVKYLGLQMGAANDHFEDLAADEQGNTYVTGWTTAKPFGTAYLTQKYDANGNLVWQNLFNGNGAGDDRSSVIAVDHNGNVAVSGVAWDFVTAAYRVTTVYYKYSSPDGQYQWTEVLPNSITSQYNEDKVTSAAFDDSGNVYLAGSMLANKQSDGTVTSDLFIAKYTSGGLLVWKKLYDDGMEGDDQATKMIVDSAGESWVTGWSDISGETNSTYPPRNIVTIKFNKEGDTVWTRKYSVIGHDNEGTAITRDSRGNIYVTGTDNYEIDYSTYHVDSDNGVMIKYNENSGDQKWVKLLPDYSPDDMAIDRHGRILVTGAVATSIGSGLETIKYAVNGNPLWTKAYDTTSSIIGKGRSLAIDADNNVYVTGSRSESTGGGYITTLKYDSTGELKWSKSQPLGYPIGYLNGYYADAGTWPIKLAVNNTDQPVVGGTGYSGKTDQDMIITSYSAAGDSLWGHYYNGTHSSNETAVKMVQDSAGNTYIAGDSYNWNGKAGIKGTSAVFGAKYDPEGNLVWSKRVGTVGLDYTWEDHAAGLAVDRKGNVYVCGVAESGDFNKVEYLTVKFNQQGKITWTRTYNGHSSRQNYDYYARDIAVDMDSVVIVTGDDYQHPLTIGYDLAGNIVWESNPQYLFGTLNRIVCDTTGNIYIAGVGEMPSYNPPSRLMIVKYNSNGDTLWTLTNKNTDLALDNISNMTPDADGNIYLAGYYDYASTYYSAIVKVTGTGEILWTKKYNQDLGSGITLATDNKDSLYAVGNSYNKYNLTYTPFISKLAPDDSVLWSKTVHVSLTTAVATDAEGNAYLAGDLYDNGEYIITTKYGSDGTVEWMNQYSEPLESMGNFSVSGISVDADNNITVACNIKSGNGSVVGIFQYNQLTTYVAKDLKPSAPSSFRLFQNYPNPFNPITKIRYSIPSVGTHRYASIRINVYDVLGREIATLVNKKQRPGNYEVTFDGNMLASGVYFYRIQAGNFIQTKKMLLLK